MSFPRYPKYKDSGVEWLGRVPVHWGVAPIGTRFQLRNGYPFKAELFSPEGESGDRLIRIRDIYQTGSRVFTSEPCPPLARVTDGDVIIGMDGDFNVAYWDQGLAKLNQRVCAVRGSSIWWDKFVFYGIKHPLQIINDLTFSTTVKHLSSTQVLKERFPLPPEVEVRKIVTFLDHETARIDALVQEQQRLIKLLKEQRQAVISHAVTKGLDPDVSMKDSGVEWLGEVPAHWTIRPLMHLTPSERKIMYGIVLPGPDIDGGVLIVKGGDVKPGRLSLEKLCRTDPAIEVKYQRSRLSAGDLVYSIRGGIGDVEIVPKEIEGANLTQDAARISPAVGVDNRWLLYALKSKLVFSQLEARATGATIRGINIMDLKRARLPVPPSSEQRALADYLDITIAKLDRLETESIAAIGLMQEHRSALISAAVTGKIDVRSWTPPRGESVLSATGKMETA